MTDELTEARLAAELAAERDRVSPHITAPGAPAVRTTITRRRRATAAAALTVVALVIAGGVAVLDREPGADRLVPAIAGHSSTPAGPGTTTAVPGTTVPSPTDDPPRPPASPGPSPDVLDEALVGLGPLRGTSCPRQIIQLHDGANDDVAVRLAGPDVQDADGDGNDDYLVELRCGDETWLVVLLGPLPQVTAITQGVRLSAPGRTVEFISESSTAGDDYSGLNLTVDGKKAQLRVFWKGNRPWEN